MFWRRKNRDVDLDRELRAHLDVETEEQRERGLEDSEARYAAQRALGNMTRIKEDTRRAWGWMWLEQFVQDYPWQFFNFFDLWHNPPGAR